MNMAAWTRFWSNVEKGPNCWHWRGHVNNQGYGKFGLDKKLISAHRIAYQCIVGQIALGLAIDHLCRNRACVNPAHMEVVDWRTNILRGVCNAAQNVRKTHCPKGHELSGTNLIANQWKRGIRDCCLCKNKRKRDKTEARRHALDRQTAQILTIEIISANS